VVNNAKLRCRNKPKSTTGRGWCNDRVTSTHNTSAASARQLNVRGSSQFQLGLCTSANIPSVTPTSSRPAPTGSGKGSSVSSRDSRNTICPVTSTSRAIGTLIQNAHRQPPALMMADPMAGPAAAPTPPKDDVMPKAVARRAGGTSRSAIAVVAVMSTDDARPMIVRPAMIMPTLFAVAHSTDPMRNSTTPVRCARLRPVRSLMTPPSTSVALETTVYELSTHDNGPWPTVGKARWISGYTTYMIERFTEGNIVATPAMITTIHTRREI
jgi:hypothetical protein